MNPLVILALRYIGKLGGASRYALGPLDKCPRVERPFHIIAIFATRSTILRFVWFGRVEPVYTVHARFKIQVVTINALLHKHRLGFVICQVPFDSTLCSSALQRIESGIDVGPVPPGRMFGIFASPILVSLVIMFAVFIRSLCNLFGPPFNVVLFFSLELIVILSSFRFRI